MNHSKHTIKYQTQVTISVQNTSPTIILRLHWVQRYTATHITKYFSTCFYVVYHRPWEELVDIIYDYYYGANAGCYISFNTVVSRLESCLVAKIDASVVVCCNFQITENLYNLVFSLSCIFISFSFILLKWLAKCNKNNQNTQMNVVR